MRKKLLSPLLFILTLVAFPPIAYMSVLATIGESEPNDSSATADVLIPSTDDGAGDLSPAGDRDWWVIGGNDVGDLAFVIIDTSLSTSSNDTEMSVFENNGTTLIDVDDDSGDGLASATAGSIIPTAGDIYVEINEFGDNATITPYGVLQRIVDPADASILAESEPNNSPNTANANHINNNVMITANLDDANDDCFSFNATAGERIGVGVDNDEDADGLFTDIEITLYSTDGATVLASEAPFTVTDANAVVASATDTGTHFVCLSNGGSGTVGESNYRFVVIVDGTIPTAVSLLSANALLQAGSMLPLLLLFTALLLLTLFLYRRRIKQMN